VSAVRLNPFDAAWILTESRAAPNHVGGLLQFRLPDRAPRDFLRRMMADFRTHRGIFPPWNRRLKGPLSRSPIPTWIEDDEIDLEYHVRHAALPWPGGERELGELVGRLHSTPVDLMRPPWECTIIEGLEGQRFALYVKMHHSLIDGVSGMKMLQRSMSTDRQKSLTLPPFWAPMPERVTKSDRRGPPATMSNVLTEAVAGLSMQVRSVPQLVGAFAKIFRRIGDPGEGMVVPFDAPLSVLNGRVREKRRFATQQFPDRAAARRGRGRAMYAQRRRARAVRRRIAALPRRTG
jgi:diacylglycerol O-acyltransferase